jgi:TorA maturation chaperone TorD
MAQASLEELADTMQARSDAYAFLARVLSDDEVTVEFLKALRDNPPQTGTSLDDFAASLAGADDKSLEQTRRELAADHSATLLGMSAKPVSPFESVYTSSVHLMMQDARDEVRAAYRAQGCAKDDAYHMPDDHVSLELDFMATLAGRTERALRTIAEEGQTARQDNEQTVERAEQAEQAANEALGAQLAFVDKHLSAWIPQLCDALERQASTDLYRGAAQMLRNLVRDDAQLLHGLSQDSEA